MGGDTMVGFGTKQAWLAVREGTDMRSARTAACEDRSREQLTAAVVAALGLRDLGTVSWRNGIDLAYLTDDRVVLTPPLPGAGDARWLLVTGRWLLRPDSAVDVAELSATLGTEVQLFATYRVSELHRWQRAVNGVLTRAFEYVGQIGEVTDWRGEPDAAEVAIGLPTALDDEASVLVSEGDVLRLAGAWSVDPSALDGRPALAPLRVAAAS